MNLINIAESISENIDVENILWQRLPYPFKKITAKDFYKACYRDFRCVKNNIQLCDFCSRIAMENDCVCENCEKILKEIRGIK